MRIAIIDDERQWRIHIKRFILNHYRNMNTEVLDYNSGTLFMSSLSKCDIVIVDLEMPEQDGFQTISEYKKIYKNSIILILTSHMELVQKGYLVNAFRYINKANFTEELEAALNAVDELKSLDEKIEIHILNAGNQSITISDILFFETENRNLRMHTIHESLICINTMEQVENLLSSKGFFRSHKSFLVNLNMVHSYNKTDITMINNESAMISIRKYSKFNQAYLDWKFNHGNS